MPGDIYMCFVTSPSPTDTSQYDLSKYRREEQTVWMIFHLYFVNFEMSLLNEKNVVS